MSRVLVDSSVWIEMFREKDTPPVRYLGELLRDGLVCTNGVIRAEILSGAKTSADLDRLADGFSALDYLPDPSDLWDQLARARFKLARRGFQAGIADLIVAISASHHKKALFTMDRAFPKIATIVPVDLVKLPLH